MDSSDGTHRYQRLHPAGGCVDNAHRPQVLFSQSQDFERRCNKRLVIDRLDNSLWLADLDSLRVLVESRIYDTAHRLYGCVARSPYAKMTKQPQCTERRMAAHFHLVPRHEEPEAERVIQVMRRANKCAFMPIRLGDGLHLPVGEMIGAEHDGRRIATLFSGCEHPHKMEIDVLHSTSAQGVFLALRIREVSSRVERRLAKAAMA